MRKKDKNLLFKVVEQSRYGLDAFTLSNAAGIHGGQATILKFNDSNMVFFIEPAPNNYDLYFVDFTFYGPTYNIFPADSSRQVYDIDEVLKIFANWLNNHVAKLVEDLEEPDFWNIYNSIKDFTDFQSVENSDASNFTIDEIQQIELLIGDYKQMLTTRINPSKEQLAIINKKLDYLVEATKRLQKRDWLGISISIISSIVVALTLDKEMGNFIIDYFVRLFRTIHLLSH